MSAPITFPTASSPWPFFDSGYTAVTSSGREVPNATSVAAMMLSGTPSRMRRFLNGGDQDTAKQPMTRKSAKANLDGNGDIVLPLVASLGISWVHETVVIETAFP